MFLLGPSHHYYTCKCALSKASVYKTPLGELPIDMEGNCCDFIAFFFAWGGAAWLDSTRTLVIEKDVDSFVFLVQDNFYYMC